MEILLLVDLHHANPDDYTDQSHSVEVILLYSRHADNII